jgi:tetratricopeptide (TPR) repeat protein
VSDPQALVELAERHRHAGRLRDAVLACDAAIRAAPGCAEAWLERGFVFASGGSMVRAAECYLRVLELDPANSPAHAGLAGIAARDGKREVARRHARAALSADPFNATATLALATVAIESGDAEAARTMLEPLVERLPAPEPDRSLAWSLLGDANDRLGEHQGAYNAYVRSKADFAAVNAAFYTGREPHRLFVERVADALAGESFAPGIEPQPPGAAARHLFLMGYPRSGNTLVENVLASLPGVSALEERPTLRDADRVWLSDSDALRRLAGAPEAQLAEFRAAYWHKVGEAGVDAAGKTFVDMDPLKGTRLPIIARLFPDALMVIMRRDPRDVVWSCFRTNFALTNAALDFTTIEGAARHYDAMMRVIEAARERLALGFHQVRYEDLVGDFDATTQALCAFAGLPWDESVRSFAATAARRGVATASGGQVRKGLYDGRRQWEPYAEWLAPALPWLQPWIERFGYA